MKFSTLLILIGLCACSATNKSKKEKALFDSSKITRSFKSVADMNDSYFVIKENNFFEFYRQLFDSVKNSSYAGRFTKIGDTLDLDFYDKKGAALLGSKAVVDETKNRIVFFK